MAYVHVRVAFDSASWRYASEMFTCAFDAIQNRFLRARLLQVRRRITGIQRERTKILSIQFYGVYIKLNL